MRRLSIVARLPELDVGVVWCAQHPRVGFAAVQCSQFVLYGVFNRIPGGKPVAIRCCVMLLLHLAARALKGLTDLNREHLAIARVPEFSRKLVCRL